MTAKVDNREKPNMQERERCSYEPLCNAVRSKFQGEDDIQILCWRAPHKCKPLIFVQDREVSVQRVNFTQPNKKDNLRMPMAR
ncbi:hypothetical protein B0G77_1571 [Paraburkholderia sp. BL10I2N1]|nr:hypothetical protein B0G77_1571 [Paraburkholderia sp. BL10I2N1]